MAQPEPDQTSGASSAREHPASTAGVAAVVPPERLSINWQAEGTEEEAAAWAAAKKRSNDGFAKQFASCCDMQGTKIDRERLRVARIQAVARGLGWIERFLGSAKNLDAIGDDAPCLYFEMYYTCGDARVALRCKELCVRVLRRRSRQLLRSAADAGTPQREHFMETMFLLRIYKELGENLSEGIPVLLFELADLAWTANGFADTEVLFGGSVASLERRRGDPDFYMVLLEMMVCEYNAILFKGRWPLQDGYGLKEGIEALKGYQYKPCQESSDDFYLVTHIVFALSAYSSIKVKESLAPSLFSYTRKSLRHWMKLARRDPFGGGIDVDG